MLVHHVQFPLGKVLIKLNRSTLELSERGGFEAFWSNEAEALTKEAYFELIKTHFAEVYLTQHKVKPSKITLNLACHQLIDDIEGWTKLNFLNK